MHKYNFSSKIIKRTRAIITFRLVKENSMSNLRIEIIALGSFSHSY